MADGGARRVVTRCGRAGAEARLRAWRTVFGEARVMELVHLAEARVGDVGRALEREKGARRQPKA